MREYTGPIDPDNPAGRIVDFMETHFVRMSCGGLILGMEHTKEHSPRLRGLRPLGKELLGKYVGAWKRSGWLN